MRNDGLRHFAAKLSALEAFAKTSAATVEQLGRLLHDSNRRTTQQIERLASHTHREISDLANRLAHTQKPNWQAAGVVVVVIGGLVGTVLLPLNQSIGHQQEALRVLAELMRENDRQGQDNSRTLVRQAEQIHELETRLQWLREIDDIRLNHQQTLVRDLWNKAYHNERSLGESAASSSMDGTPEPPKRHP